MDMTLSSDIDIDVIRQFQRSRVITAIICSCLRQLGDSKLVLHLLKPIILDHLVSFVAVHIIYEHFLVTQPII